MATFDLFRNKNLIRTENIDNQTQEMVPLKVCLKYGVLVSVLLMINFLTFCVFTSILGVHELGVINMFLLLIADFFTIHYMSTKSRDGRVDYFEGFKAGMLTSAITIGIHSLFVFVYSWFNHSILVSSPGSITVNVTPLSFASVTFFEGVAASLVITYCLMHYFKRD